jgi:hypothetical protein
MIPYDSLINKLSERLIEGNRIKTRTSHIHIVLSGVFATGYQVTVGMVPSAVVLSS